MFSNRPSERRDETPPMTGMRPKNRPPAYLVRKPTFDAARKLVDHLFGRQAFVLELDVEPLRELFMRSRRDDRARL